jgi:hypothetical protein
LCFGLAVLLYLPDEAGGFTVSLTSTAIAGRLPNILQPIQSAVFPFGGVSTWLAPALAPAAMIVVSTIVIVAIRMRPRETVMITISVMLLVANSLFLYAPYWWHAGVLFFALLTVVLVTRALWVGSWMTIGLRPQTLALWVLLAAQLASLLAPGKSLMGFDQFSTGKAAAQIIQRSCVESCPLVTDWDFTSSTVSAYLAGRPMTQVNASRVGTFTIFDPDSRQPGRIVTWGEIRDALITLGPSSVAVLSTLRNPPPDFEVLGQTSGSIWGEDFLVLRLRS